MLGFYVSGHPLDSYRGHFDSSKITKLGTLDEVDTSAKPQTVWVAGIVNKAEVRYSKKDNRPFATLTLEDFTGQCEVMVWSDDYEKHKAILQTGAVLGLRCRCQKDQRTEQNRLALYDAKVLDPKKSRRRATETENEISDRESKPVKPPAARPILVRLNPSRHSLIDLERIHEIVIQHPGDTPLIIEFVMNGGKRLRMKAGEEFKVADSRELRDALVIWG